MTTTTTTVGRRRGAYDSELHGISNDFAVFVSNMFKELGADIKKVVVNDNKIELEAENGDIINEWNTKNTMPFFTKLR